MKKGGAAMVSMQDIADKAGVSRVTVSRVLSNHPSVKAETRQKVLRWVKELDYEPNLIAQSLAGNRTNIIGLLVPEIAYPFFSEIIESIENQAFYEGYSIIICNTHRSLLMLGRHKADCRFSGYDTGFQFIHSRFCVIVDLVQ